MKSAATGCFLGTAVACAGATVAAPEVVAVGAGIVLVNSAKGIFGTIADKAKAYKEWNEVIVVFKPLQTVKRLSMFATSLIGVGNWTMRKLKIAAVHAAIAFPTLGFLIEIDSDSSNGEVLAERYGTSVFKSSCTSVVDRIYLLKRRIDVTEDWEKTGGWTDHSFRGKLKPNLSEYDLKQKAISIFNSKNTYDLIKNNCQHLAYEMADYATN